jgi:alpha-L-rhamnosidase
MDLAEEAMYNFWSPGVYEFFLEQIRDSQVVGAVNGTSLISGDVTVAVPVHGGVDARSQDIAWTAGYPIITSWLLQYYGTAAMAQTVRSHWSPLKHWVDAQLRHASNSSSMNGLPALTTYGDQENPKGAAHSVGRGLSAANFILSVEAMATMADAIGETVDAASYRSMSSTLKAKYEMQYWNSVSMGYSPVEGGVQTMNAIAIAVGVGGGERADQAAAALLRDVKDTNTNHLTVGHSGAKHLLNTLSGLSLSANDSSYHDTALRVAMQQEYPSWGYWLKQGGTTCWETWDGINPQNTRNHGWLCGGVGEWMYKYMAGIRPTSPGYATVSIAPLVSPTVGPSSVNATVQTIRGPVKSAWTRGGTNTTGSGLILQLSCALPVGIEAEVMVPLLGHSSSRVVLRETAAGIELWSGARSAAATPIAPGISALSVAPNGQSLVFRLGPGDYHLELLDTP